VAVDEADDDWLGGLERAATALGVNRPRLAGGGAHCICNVVVALEGGQRGISRKVAEYSVDSSDTSRELLLLRPSRRELLLLRADRDVQLIDLSSLARQRFPSTQPSTVRMLRG
jgi:hypothetical protein